MISRNYFHIPYFRITIIIVEMNEHQIYEEEVNFILEQLHEHASVANIRGQERYGIRPGTNLGIPQPILRSLAKNVGINHALALELWKSNIHEARHLATMIADPMEVTEQLMERWVKDFNSWDIVDGCCSNLFRKTPFAFDKAITWCERKEEFVRRAGFSLMAFLAVHDKKAKDSRYEAFFPYIYKYSDDDRNMVKKAVNWALRQIGKRNERLCKKAIALAKKIRQLDDASSKWIAADALRELEKYLESGKIKSVGIK